MEDPEATSFKNSSRIGCGETERIRLGLPATTSSSVAEPFKVILEIALKARSPFLLLHRTAETPLEQSISGWIF